MGFVQQSATMAVSNTGTTTPAFPAQSTAGNLLLACLESRTGGTPFTGPAGWIQGPTAVQGSLARSEIWYYPANPGTVTSASFTSGTAQVRGCLIEFTPPAGPVATDSTGTATAVSGATLTVTAGSANVSGDLAICCFGVHYTAATSITWTDPSGFTLIDSDGGSTNDHGYAAYQLPVIPGTLSVTGTVSTSTNLNAFVGVTACFFYTPAQRTPQLPGLTMRTEPISRTASRILMR